MFNPRLSFYKWKNWMVAIFRVYNFENFFVLIFFFVVSKKKPKKMLLSFHYFLFPTFILHHFIKYTFPFFKANFAVVVWARKWVENLFSTLFRFRLKFCCITFGSKCPTIHTNIHMYAIWFVALVFFAKGERLKQCWTCAFYYLRWFFRSYGFVFRLLFNVVFVKDIHNTNWLWVLFLNFVDNFISAQKLFFPLITITPFSIIYTLTPC